MLKLVKFLLVPMSLISLSAQAARPTDGELILSLFGVVNDSVKDDGSSGRDNSYNFGAGALVEANVNGFLGIETGAIFVKRQYEYGSGPVSLVQEVGRLHVPAVVKFWPTNFLAVGIGPYASFKVGDVKNTLEIGGVGGSVDTKADDDVELGLDATVTLNFSVADKTGIFVEGRYSKPFDEGDDTELDSMTGLVGVKISM